ncbi:MAG: DUF2793 domain-containing protein [Pseudomonadota bacterium]
MPEDTSPVLGLPLIQAAQAQKHVTHNEALVALEALTQLAVESAALTVPPGAPDQGARYIVAAPATGDWAGQEGQIALYDTGAWRFFAPRRGWQAHDGATGTLLVHDGADWTPFAGGGGGLEPGDLQNLPGVGIGGTSDAGNPLVVSGPATLLNHGGAGHQLKINKATAGDTASLLFQTGFGGRAEMGLAGSDAFAIKVSDDGATFHTAITTDPVTGQVSFPNGITGIQPPQFGGGAALSVDYVTSRGLDLVTNSTGFLGDGYNFPTTHQRDGGITPNLPSALSYAGYRTNESETTEFIAVDPNKVHRIATYLRQEGLAGDWSAFAHGERHQHSMGLRCYDADQNYIHSFYYARYHANGVDSLTTLSAPLAPGDTVVHLTDATGWNDLQNPQNMRGLIIFGYRDSFGRLHDHYSRIRAADLFETSGVDKVLHRVTLKAPLPASMGNPEDPGGVWPAGTPIANTGGGEANFYALFQDLVLPQTDRWYEAANVIGGINRSGKELTTNFPPGTVYLKVFWWPNFSNRAGGVSGFPDTGAAHRVWFAGISVTPDPVAAMRAEPDGTVSLKTMAADFDTGAVSLTPAALMIKEVL